MPSPSVEKVLAYLDALEADRKAALALSEQKAEEARLIKARQEGLRSAMEILCGELFVQHSEADPEIIDPVRRDPPVKEPAVQAEAHPIIKEPVQRRGRRPIPQLILRELSFSGAAMTVTQIAKAIGYNPVGTETALKRMASAGHVLRDEGGRWAIDIPGTTRLNGHAHAAE
jgi:hypothetical protein